MARSIKNPAQRKRELAKTDTRAVKNDKPAQKKPVVRAARAGADRADPRSSKANAPVAKPVATSNVRSLAARAFIRRMNKTP